jgi:cell division protein FtsL
MEEHLHKVMIGFQEIVSIMNGDYQYKADMINQEISIIDEHLGHVCEKFKELEARVKELERKQRIGF